MQASKKTTMAKSAFRNSVSWAIAALGIIGSHAACGTSAGSPSGDAAGCAAGAVYCAACNGGGFCSSQGCPAYECPVTGSADAEAGTGASDALDGGGATVDGAIAVDGGASTDGGAAIDGSAIQDGSPIQGAMCFADKPVYCADCNGGGFCVSGACPATTCPVREASVVVPPSDAAPTSCGTCGASQICVRPSCGGGVGPLCTPVYDAGPAACPTGWTYSASCSSVGGLTRGPGCTPPACVAPSPFCVDIPAACGGRPSCGCLDSNICRGNGQCGAILNGNEVWCGFA